jgi:hypothetical protein
MTTVTIYIDGEPHDWTLFEAKLDAMTDEELAEWIETRDAGRDERLKP